MLTHAECVLRTARADAIRAVLMSLGREAPRIRATLEAAGIDLAGLNPLAAFVAAATGWADVRVHPDSGRWGCFGFPTGHPWPAFAWYDLPPGVGDFGCRHARGWPMTGKPAAPVSAPAGG